MTKLEDIIFENFGKFLFSCLGILILFLNIFASGTDEINGKVVGRLDKAIFSYVIVSLTTEGESIQYNVTSACKLPKLVIGKKYNIISKKPLIGCTKITAKEL